MHVTMSYSEDAVLTAGQGAATIAAGQEYGAIIAPKHLAFNDTESMIPVLQNL